MKIKRISRTEAVKKKESESDMLKLRVPTILQMVNIKNEYNLKKMHFSEE